MPITFCQGHYKGRDGYIKTVSEKYAPVLQLAGDKMPGESQPGESHTHHCMPDCPRCQDRYGATAHKCYADCMGCYQTQRDVAEYKEVLTRFHDIHVQISSGSDIISASIRDIRPTK